MQAMYLEALGLENTKAGEELVNHLEKAVGAKTLTKQLPKMLSKLIEEGRFDVEQRKQLSELNPKKLPKDLLELSALDFQQRLGKFQVSPPVATMLLLQLQLELVNLISAHHGTAESVARKATKKQWEGASQVKRVATDWIAFLDQRRYALAQRMEKVGQAGQGGLGGASGTPGSEAGPIEPPGAQVYRRPNGSQGPDPATPPPPTPSLKGGDAFRPSEMAPLSRSSEASLMPPGAVTGGEHWAGKAEPSQGSAPHDRFTQGDRDPFMARAAPPSASGSAGNEGGLPELEPAPAQGPFGSGAKLPERSPPPGDLPDDTLPDLTPPPTKRLFEDPTPRSEPTPAPTMTPTRAPAPSGPSGADEQTPDIQGQTFDGRDYKFFIKGKGVKMVRFQQTRPGRAVLEVEQAQELLDKWMERQDPTVAYLVEKSGERTIPLQGCLIMERKVVYEVAFRTGLEE